MPHSCLLYPEPLPLLTHTSAGDTQTLKGRSGSVSVGSPVVYKVLFEPSEHLWRVWGLILNTILPPYCPAGASPLPLDVGYIFWWDPTLSCGIQHSPVDGCSAVSCNFGVLTGENEHTSFHSTILEQVSVNGLSCCSLHLLVPSFPKLTALIPEEWLFPGIL